MDEILKDRTQQDNNNHWHRASELSTISSVLCPHLLTSMIEKQLNLRFDAINIGAMNCYDVSYLDNCNDALIENDASTTNDIVEDV